MKHCWKSDDGRIALYCIDCIKLLPHLKLEKIGAVITDPPYGISREASSRPHSVFKGKLKGDEQDFDPSPWIGMAPIVILWGANNFSSWLPRGGWIVWDKRLSKRVDNMLGSPFELAWHSNPKLYKMIRVLHGGVINADSKEGDNKRRLHPTQKPIQVMSRCIEISKLSPDSIVLDPYMGSGTTGIACIRTGHRFIGIEIDEGYFQIAAKRIKDELREISTQFFNIHDRFHILKEE